MMGDYWGNPSRIESLQRAVRDEAVHGAMSAHADLLRDEVDRRLVVEIANLAVHTALLKYSTYLQTEIARIESAERMRADKAMASAMPNFIANLGEKAI